MKYLFAAALFLLPLSLRAQDSLAGQWKIDPAQLEQVQKTIEPIIATAEAKALAPAEKEKVRQTLTAAYTGQHVTFIKSADGIWEQEMNAEGVKARFPVTFIKAGKGDTYEVHRSGKLLFTVTLFDADHLTLTNARTRMTFPMIRSTDATLSEGPKATTKTAGGEVPPTEPKR